MACHDIISLKQKYVHTFVVSSSPKKYHLILHNCRFFGRIFYHRMRFRLLEFPLPEGECYGCLLNDTNHITKKQVGSFIIHHSIHTKRCGKIVFSLSYELSHKSNSTCVTFRNDLIFDQSSLRFCQSPWMRWDDDCCEFPFFISLGLLLFHAIYFIGRFVETHGIDDRLFRLAGVSSVTTIQKLCRSDWMELHTTYCIVVDGGLYHH